MNRSAAQRHEDLRRRWIEGTGLDRAGIASVIVAAMSLVLGLVVPPMLAVAFLALCVLVGAAAVSAARKRRESQPDDSDAPTVILAVLPAASTHSQAVDRGAERAARRAQRTARRDAARAYAQTHYTVMMHGGPNLVVDADAGTLRRGSQRRGEVRSMHGVTIELDVSGSVNRRATLTRAAALGPLALAVKKKVDDRTLHVTINGPQWQWAYSVEGRWGNDVRAHMAKVTTSVRQWQTHTAAPWTPPLQAPAPNAPRQPLGTDATPSGGRGCDGAAIAAHRLVSDRLAEWVTTSS